MTFEEWCNNKKFSGQCKEEFSCQSCCSKEISALKLKLERVEKRECKYCCRYRDANYCISCGTDNFKLKESEK